MNNSKLHLEFGDAEQDLSRRQLIKTGVSCAAYLSAAQLLRLATGDVAYAQADTSSPKKRLIWINMSGGWDVLEATDPKQNSTAGIDMAYGWGAAQQLVGSQDVRIGRWLPRIAAHGADVVVLRGMTMGTTSHDAGHVYMDTGVLSNTGRVNAASVPAIVAAENNAVIPLIQLSGGSEPRTDRALPRNLSTVRAENLDLYRKMYPSDAKSKETSLLLLDHLKESTSRVQSAQGTTDRLNALISAETRIREQIQSNIGGQLEVKPADRIKFNAPFANLPAGMGMARRPDGLIDSFALALKLLQANLVTCVNLGVGGFDTHANQDRSLEPLLTGFDIALGVFIDELKAAGQLDSTLIVLFSDFGRTPKINGNMGRDHWPIGGAIMIGGGIAGGRAVGESDDKLLSKEIDLTTGAAAAGGKQLSPALLAGSVLELTVGSAVLRRRGYLQSCAALTRLRS